MNIDFEMLQQEIKVFLLLLMLAVGIMYFIAARRRGPLALPGDLLIMKAGRTIYIPIGSSLVIAIILYALLSALKS